MSRAIWLQPRDSPCTLKFATSWDETAAALLVLLYLSPLVCPLSPQVQLAGYQACYRPRSKGAGKRTRGGKLAEEVVPAVPSSYTWEQEPGGFHLRTL